MITDGYKKPITEQNINYKPYGEIDYKDSDGVNLSKYKYTGQEEDKESGLLYYKSRYYDPMLARFLQADSEADIDEVSGMNRYSLTYTVMFYKSLGTTFYQLENQKR